MDDQFYNTIGVPSTAEFKDRGSKFIAYAYPVETINDFKKCLQQIKKEHSKAGHHCFAYRIGSDGNNFRASDDGEPSGTAGKPILGQIDSKGLINITIIVVRYWGGTLLGVPGLINAYKTSASLALQITPIIRKPIEIKYSLEFDYTKMNEVMMIMKQCNCTIVTQEIQLFCNIIAGVPLNRLEEVLYKLKDFQNVEVKKVDNNL
ncbi:MAG: YigZ family protein [Chitinophagaceae bacterium]|nr:YigZ family protein [Chitinophagaceae bacterium]